MAISKLQKTFQVGEFFTADDHNQVVDSSVLLSAVQPPDHSASGSHEPARFEKGIAAFSKGGSWQIDFLDGIANASIVARTGGGFQVTLQVERPFPTEDTWGVISYADGIRIGAEILQGKTEDTTTVVFAQAPSKSIVLLVVGVRRE